MAIQIDHQAPFFQAEAVTPDGEFKTISLDDYKGRWLVLFFYPLDFTFVCPTEIRGYDDHFEQFQNMEADVLGVSVDSKFSHKAWIENGLGELQFPLLADITKEISRNYGVLLEAGGIATRGTFIIDPDGELKACIITNPDIGRSVKETLRLLEAARMAREGNLVPCEWTPGAPVI